MKKAWLVLMVIAIALAVSCHPAKQFSRRVNNEPGTRKHTDQGLSPLIGNVFMLFTNQ